MMNFLGCLSPTTPQLKPQSLNNLCLRTAAIYVTTSLYDFHDKQTNHVVDAEEIQGGNFDIGYFSSMRLNKNIIFFQSHIFFEV